MSPGCAFVELHELDADGLAGAPYRIPVQAPAPAGVPLLVLVAGPLARAQARTQALRIVEQQAGAAPCLAVCEIDGAEPAGLDELHPSFHAVLLVARGQGRQVATRLLRTMLKLEGQDQWIACDWHELMQMMESARGTALRLGSGQAAGAGRAALATQEAILQAERQAPGLGAARGVCIGIRAGSTLLGGAEIKEAIHQIRARVSPQATIMMSIGADSALDAGALEVDVLAFGERDEAAATAQAAGADPEPAGHGGEGAGDPLYAAARSLVLQHRRASISLVQRHLRIGYGRAARLLDAMQGDILSARREDGSRMLLAP